MGIFDNGQTAQDTGNDYQQAQGYLNPYYQGGLNGFNQYQNYTNQMGNNLQPYQNAGANLWGSLNQNPTQMYQGIMGGYSQSPQAAYAQQQAMQGANAAAAASGGFGSGSYYKGIMNNANDISQRDQQQYFQNVMGTGQQQLGILGNLQGQQQQYANQLNNIAGYGYGAAGQMANNAMNYAQMQQQQDQTNQANQGGLFGSLGSSLFGQNGMFSGIGSDLFGQNGGAMGGEALGAGLGLYF